MAPRQPASMSLPNAASFSATFGAFIRLRTHNEDVSLTRPARPQKSLVEYGTPALVIDMDRVESNIAPHPENLRRCWCRQPASYQDAQKSASRSAPDQGRCERHHLPETRRSRSDGHSRHRRHPHQLQPDRRTKRSRASAPLLAKTNVTVTADNDVVIVGLPAAAAAAERALPVVIECDTGRKRAGVEDARGSHRPCKSDQEFTGD